MRRTISLLSRPQTHLFGTNLTNSEQKDSHLQKKILIESIPTLRAVLVARKESRLAERGGERLRAVREENAATRQSP